VMLGCGLRASRFDTVVSLRRGIRALHLGIAVKLEHGLRASRFETAVTLRCRLQALRLGIAVKLGTQASSPTF